MPLILNVTFILYFVSTSFSFYFFLLHLDYSIHFLWRWLHHFCYYSTYTELSRYCFCYDVYVHYISDSRMFIVHILTWLIWNTISVHWKLLFIVLPQFTKPNVDNIANHLIATWIYSFLPLPITPIYDFCNVSHVNLYPHLILPADVTLQNGSIITRSYLNGLN